MVEDDWLRRHVTPETAGAAGLLGGAGGAQAGQVLCRQREVDAGQGRSASQRRESLRSDDPRPAALDATSRLAADTTMMWLSPCGSTLTRASPNSSAPEIITQERVIICVHFVPGS
eukprot:3820338-Rhodomonas_salina.1